MIRFRSAFLALSLLAAGISTPAQQAAPGSAPAPAGAADAAVRQKIGDYLRHLYAWGPEVKLAVAPLKETGVPGILETTADLEMAGQKESAKLFVSRDGKYLFRGELTDMSQDPLAEIRAKLKLDNAPATGDPKAPVTLVEFADFQCPVCKQLHDVMRTVLPSYPQARLVFKDFPLSSLHPWARSAAIAARCAFQQDPKAFWTFYDRIYNDQEVISAENAWTKMTDYAGDAGLNTDTFKSCMASPEAAQAVDASFENGREVEVASTPTVFVNGRRLVGADAAQLEQYIRYELEHPAGKAEGKKP
ncbi:MAG: thioredoxin domain-containing protein [Acidobacteriia bacterium]|nr:thioredoxin domain-containing protein [Terriglobia bacterium]